MSTTSHGSETRACPMCGGEILAVARKCKHCKRYLPAPAAPPPEHPVQRPAPPADSRSADQEPAPPASPLCPPPPGRRRAYAWWAAGGVAALAACAMAIALFLRPAPEDSIEKVRSALLAHDEAAFNAYVDVPSVLGSAIDDYVDRHLATRQAGFDEQVLAKALAEFGKALLLQKLSSHVAHALVGASPANLDLSPDTHPAVARVAGVLADAVRTAIASRIAYGGILSTSSSGDAAVVTVRVTFATTPAALKLRLRRVEDRWRVVAVADSMQLAEQLLGAPLGALARPVAPPAPGAGQVRGSEPGAPGPAVPADVRKRIQLNLGLASKDPRNRDAWVQLGNDFYDTGQFQRSVDAYQRALELDPEDPDVLTDQGVMLWKLGRTDGALRNFEMASELDPSHAMSLLNMGVVYDQLQQADKAIGAWRRTIEVDPNGDAAAKARTYLTAKGVLERP